jgi:tRNA nucleotidyltransferase (CCA-adding enzyme)
MLPNTWSFWENWIFADRPHQSLLVWQDQKVLAEIPELAALQGVPQDPRWHPEGDVWIHTVLVCEQAALIAKRDQLSAHERRVLLLAALCHDFGKPKTTFFERARWRSPRHAAVGVGVTTVFLERIGCPAVVCAEVLPLVQEHLAHINLCEPSVRAVKRLLNCLRPASFEQLARLVEADLGGRPPLPKGIPTVVQRLREVLNQIPAEPNLGQPIVAKPQFGELSYS